jgi:hypothetical protein
MIWNNVYEKGLVDVMHDHKDNPKFKGQKGWNRDGWNSITTKFNEKFPLSHFSKQQLQEERELKGYYKAIRDSRKKSGVGWNDTLCMVLAEPEVWPRLIRVSKLSLYNSIFVHSICSLLLLKKLHFMLHLIGSPKGVKVLQQAIPSSLQFRRAI